MGNPAGPVDPVEKPIHHNQQDYDGEEASARLNIECRRIDCPNNGDHDEPGRDSRQDGRAGTDGDRSSKCGLRADEAGADRGQYKDRFQPLAEDQYAGIEHDRAMMQAMNSRIGRT
jgi:hypothetical protein